MAPEKRRRQDDEGKARKDDQRPAAVSGLQSNEEQAFPRGGASALSARERREIHLAAEKEVEKELAQGLLTKVSVKVATSLASPLMS